jgi:hypothetical protein
MGDDHITLDEFRVVILAPRDRSDEEHTAMHRPLDTAAFRRLLRRAAARVCRRFPDLAGTTVRVTR